MFLRLFLLLNLFFVGSLYACKGGYASCVQKFNDASVIQNSFLSIPLENNRRLLYAHATPDIKIIKHDPFLSLYLVQDTKPFAYPYDINMRLQLGVAVVSSKQACEGRFITEQIGLNHLAHFSEKYAYPALLSSSCCSLEGIATKQGIIQKEYLHHFITSKSSTYGDIGIRVKNLHGAVVVSASDPFMRDNPLRVGDKVRSFDSKKINNAAELMRKILFAPIGTKHTLTIERDNHLLHFQLRIHKRYGGGALSDTFLEQKGIYFDKTLHITQLQGAFTKYGLILGDRLLQVNGVAVKNQEALRRYLEKTKNYSSLLFERNGFEFFVNIK